ncbi:metal-dependent transcriptional regulator [Actinomyces vulturis]|uniref:metal-dependent transcriptional regulator n=1 Tax=Actinomyces vulturis TaxID=1857645 RepID=UPI000832E74A|nr:metal-dependent transcriptional regulator [Actinomyces vulturis]
MNTSNSTASVDSPVTQDYIKAVWACEEWSWKGASITELARHMNVAMSTASENVSRLAEAGLVHHEPYRPVVLTDKGRAIATQMVRRHRLIETYLVQHLGYDWDEVHDEAEILEHAVSDRLIAAIDEILDHPTRDPHGDPIPAEDGTIKAPVLCPIQLLPVGQSAVVGRIVDDPKLLRELSKAGVGVGSTVTMLGRDTKDLLLETENGTVLSVAEDHMFVEAGDHCNPGHRHNYFGEFTTPDTDFITVKFAEPAN